MKLPARNTPFRATIFRVAIVCAAILCASSILLIASCRPSSESPQPDSNAAKTPKHETLHQAAEAGDLDDVKLHIERGANVNQRDQEGYAPLQIAIDNDHTEVAEYLLSIGAKNTRIQRVGPATPKP